MTRSPSNTELRALAEECDQAARAALGKWHRAGCTAYAGDLTAMRRADRYELLAQACRDLLWARAELEELEERHERLVAR